MLSFICSKLSTIFKYCFYYYKKDKIQYTKVSTEEDEESLPYYEENITNNRIIHKSEKKNKYNYSSVELNAMFVPIYSSCDNVEIEDLETSSTKSISHENICNSITSKKNYLQN